MKIGKYVLLVGLSIFTLSSFSQVPSINSFTPLSGSPGTIVTISGTNFNAVAANNFVFFGAVKAVVSNATTTSLTVIVPKGASFKPITVTNSTNGLTGYSPKSFLPTFPGGDDNFSVGSFDAGTSFTTNVSPYQVAVGDIDTDGKPDMVTVCDPGGSAYTLSFLRNISQHGSISFAPKVDITNPTYSAESIALADIDGDGRLDVITGGNPKLFVFRNQSAPGTISFAAPFELSSINSGFGNFQVNDFDKDGKPDVIALTHAAVVVFKNNSTVGSISLAAPVLVTSIANSLGVEEIRLADFDGDNNTDIAMTLFIDDSISIIRNTSVPGTISFAAPVQYSTGTYSDPQGLTIGDIDNDNADDIIIAAPGAERISIYKNTSTPGNISFTEISGLANEYFAFVVAVADLNGDGKLDLVDDPNDYIAVRKSYSTPCNSVFDPRIDLEGYIIRDIVLNDMNGDDKPDIITSKNSADALKIYKNNVGQKVVSCAGGNIVIPSSHKGGIYQWQQNTGSGFVNTSDNADVTGSNTELLQINNIPVSWNGYKYRCLVDTDTSNVFVVSINTTMTPSVNITGCPTYTCSANNTVTLTATPINGGTNPVYQWQDSINTTGWRNITGATTSSLIYNGAANGNAVRCLMTSNIICASPANVVSNKWNFNVYPSLTASVSISGNTTVSSGYGTTLTAVATNGGSTVSYQWQDSTGPSSWKNIPGATSTTLAYTPGQTGNKIRCIMSGNKICTTPYPATSNVLVFTVNTVTAVSTISAERYGIRCYPNPVASVLNIDSLKPGDKWQSLTISSLDGKQLLPSKNISGLLHVAIDIEGLPAGQYIAVLRRKQGLAIYLKFVKL